MKAKPKKTKRNRPGGKSLKTMKAVYRKLARRWNNRLPDNLAGRADGQFAASSIRRKTIEAVFRQIHAEVNECLATHGEEKSDTNATAKLPTKK